MKLPTNWELKTLGDICLPPQYGWTTKASSSGKIRLLRTTDITSSFSIDWDTVPYCTEEPNDPEKYLLKDGDIVISRAGSVGFSKLIKNPQESVFASYLIRFRPLINEKYLAYFLQSPTYWQAISDSSLGIAIPNVNASKLKLITIPIAPLPEQERIVERIESLFSHLDAGVAALKRASAALKRYRASVLKAACEGRLVPQDPEDEPAEELLKRMLAEKGAKIRDLPDGLPGLPAGWCWARIGDLSQAIQYGTSEKTDQEETGIAVLRMGNIQDGQLDFSNLKYLAENTKGLKSLILDQGDLLFNRTNSAELVGKSAIYKEFHPRATFASYLIRVKFHDYIQSDYIAYFINSVYGREYIKSVVSQQVGQANVNGTKLANMPIPLPPAKEQHRVVSEVERLLSVIQEMDNSISIDLTRASRLRQSILKLAFRGEI